MAPRSGPKFSRLDSSSTGLEIVPSQPGGLSMSEKHELVYEIAKWPEGASEILQNWTRREILQILCLEMGKERKYTGLSKCKIIEQLLKLVASKEAMKQEAEVVTPLQSSAANPQNIIRRQRKKEHPLRLSAATHTSSIPEQKSPDNALVCKNLACRAILSSEDLFCKRCSCCICHQFDDNKDPSLWLVCTSEPPYEGDSCGLSCHVECALKHERSTISRDGQLTQLDGSYCCMACGKVNGLIGCWRKQLVTAKDARRVDVLCFRISLSQRLLNGTVQYREVHEIVEKAAKKLEDEVGPVSGVSAKMARGIVSRLSSGPEVQKLCAMALEKADAMLSWISQSKINPQFREDLSPIASRIQFDNIASTSVVVVLDDLDSKASSDVVGYNLWHRKVEERSYCEEPTQLIWRTERRPRISNLQPSTEYIFKVVSFTNKGELGHTEGRCFTKSDDKNHKSVESRTTGELRTSGKLGSENFSSISVEEDVLPNDCASNFKVLDIGKVLLAASASKQESSGTLECLDKDLSTEHFPCEKPQDYSNKIFDSTDQHINAGLTAQYKGSKKENIGCDLNQIADPEDAHGDSVSALDEERAMVETGLVQSSHVQAESQRDSTNSSDNNQVIELPKRDHKNHSKVTLLEEASNDNEFSMPSQNEMDVVPFDCSHPVLPISVCKGDDSGTGILRNGHLKTNGKSENWNVKPIKEVAALEPQTGGSRKRSLNRYNDKTLPTVDRMSSLDLPGCLEKNYEYCVKVIRWLEREGHIQKEFRIKFLTWFSLRATPQERRIVSVFVDTMSDDHASLAGQLVDTFSESIYSKRAQVLRSGFCSKLWH